MADATPRWLVDVGDRVPLLDQVAHPPIVVGDRVLIAGSQIGYVAVDRERGAVAWRRPGGQTLAAPLVVSPHDVVLLGACPQPIAVAADRVVVACFDRLDPIDRADRVAGVIHAPLADADACARGTAPWQLRRDGDRFVASRPGCGLAFTLPDGAAVRVAAPAPIAPMADDVCQRLADGTPWCQLVVDGASLVELDGARLPGLSVLAAARDDRRTAIVVRADATLRHDVLYALVDGAVRWSWPLPAPLDDGGRAAPIGVSISSAGVFVLFDTSRVAAFAPP